MKQKLIMLFLIAIMVTTTLVSALEPQDLLSPQQLQDTIQSLLSRLSFLAGGIFFFYVVLLLVRMYYERKKVKLLEDIRNDVDKLTIHFGIKHAHDKKGILQRLFRIFVPESEEDKKRKK